MPPSVGRIALRSISGRKAGKDHARSQCPEKHPGTQGPLRGETFVGSTLSLAAISGFTVLKRTAVAKCEIPHRTTAG